MESEGGGEQSRLFRKNPKSGTIIKTSGAVSQRLVKNENRPTSLTLSDDTKSLNFPGTIEIPHTKNIENFFSRCKTSISKPHILISCTNKYILLSTSKIRIFLRALCFQHWALAK